MTTIEGLQEAVAGVAGGVGKSVVGVAGRRSAGSGVVVASGRVLTNAHNLWRGAEEGVTVTFADGRTAEAKPLGIDADADVAVLEVDTGDAPVDRVERRRRRRHRRTRLRRRQPRRTQDCASRSGSSRGPSGRSAAPADVASPSRSSTPHRCCPDRPGARSWTATDTSSASTRTVSARASTSRSRPTTHCKRRVDTLSKGETPKRLKLGVAIAPADVARKLRRAVGLARGRRTARPRRRRGQRRGRGRAQGRRPHHAGRRQRTCAPPTICTPRSTQQHRTGSSH